MDTNALGEEGMDDFMSLGTFSQPSTSDFIFGPHKAGMLTTRVSARTRSRGAWETQAQATAAGLVWY
jgi:hypothetical protein